MASLGCPHCHTNVPFGARVCTGCQAEVHYGPPRALTTLLFVGAVFAGWVIGAATSFVVGLVVFAAVEFGGLRMLSQKYRERAEFKRLYRTVR